jgi:membrane protein DedA with SNARE-associated domain
MQHIVCAHVTDDEQAGDDRTGQDTSDELTLAGAAPVPPTGPLWVVAFVALVVCTNIAAASWAALETDRAVELLLLSSRNRYLVLTVPSGISPLTWALVATLRLLTAALVCHMIGRCYGDRALRWFWRFLGMPQQQVAKFEQQVARAEWLIVPFFVGSNIVWALTGAARTSWKRLMPLALIGIAVRLVLLWWLAKAFESQLRSVIDWTNRYQLWIIIGSVAIVVIANVRNFRSGR